MITVQKLIDATPMYQSLSEKAQARLRKRLAKRLHKFFSKSGAVTDSLDDDFLSRFEVTADNAKKVTNLAGGIFSFSGLDANGLQVSFMPGLSHKYRDKHGIC